MMIGLVAGLLAGCVTVPVYTIDPTSPFSDNMVLTSKELAKFREKGSLMDAIERARPLWLSTRGATPMVLVDGAPATDLSILRGIQASDVEEARLDRPTTSQGHLAIAANGIPVDGPVIVVKTSRRRSRGSPNPPGYSIDTYKC
jgi:hypothetical protein